MRVLFLAGLGLVLATISQSLYAQGDDLPPFQPPTYGGPAGVTDCGPQGTLQLLTTSEGATIEVCFDMFYALLGVYDTPEQAPFGVDESGGTIPNTGPAGAGEATYRGSSEGVNGDGATCKRGNPIDVLSRNKYQRETDFTGPGQLPLRIDRHYNSSFSGSDEFEGLFGRGWSSNLEQRIVSEFKSPPGAPVQVHSVVMQGESGYRFRMTSTNGEPWVTTSGTVVSFGYNETAQLYTWIDGPLTKVFYKTGDLQSISHRNGEFLLFDYNTVGTSLRLGKVRHSFGSTLEVFYNSNGKISSIRDPGGRSYIYRYDSYRNLDSVDRPEVSGVAIVDYVYSTNDAANRSKLVSVRYPQDGGAFGRYGYANATSGTAVSSERGPFGNERFTFQQVSSGSTLVIEETNPKGKKTRYHFVDDDGVRRIQTVQGLADATCLAANSSYTYDVNGYYDKVTDEEGRITDYDHNSRGLRTKVTTGFGTSDARTVATSWHPVHDVVTYITTPWLDIDYDIDDPQNGGNGLGLVQAITYIDKSHFASTTPDRTWRFSREYWSDGVTLKRLTVDGPLAGTDDETIRQYDNRGRLTSMTREVSSTRSLTTTYSNYDAYGRARRIVMPSGLVRQITYHPRGRVLSVTDTVDGVARVTQYGYHENGDLRSMTRPNGSTLTYHYDSARRLIEIRDAQDQKVRMRYDTAGNMTAREFTSQQLRWVLVPDTNCGDDEPDEPLGPSNPWFPEPPSAPAPPDCGGGTLEQQLVDDVAYSKTFEYDSLNRPTRIIKDPSKSQAITYLRDGQVDEMRDGFNRVTKVEYDVHGASDFTRYRDGGTSTTTYNPTGDIDGIRDAAGRWTYYRRNGFGEVRELQSPATGLTRYEYDNAGNVSKTTDAAGNTLAYRYDSIGRLLDVRTPGNYMPFRTYTYDTEEPGYLYRTFTADSYTTTTFIRNDAGELLSESRNNGPNGMRVSYAYTSGGQISRITYPNGVTAYYGYDNLGQVTAISVNGGPLTSSRTIVQNIDYYPFGPVNYLQFGNGETRTAEYDNNYEIASLSSGSGLQYTYQRDANANITGFGGRTFGYDIMDRLRSHSGGPDGSFSYTYDRNGNRSSSTRNGSTHYLYYDYNRGTLYGRYNGGVSESRGSDSRGNTTYISSSGQATRYFDYNSLNRLWRYREGSTTANYYYDAFGQRSRKQVGSVRTEFAYNGSRLMYEATGSNDRAYIYLGDEIVGVVRGNSVWFVHNDHLGRPERISSSSRATLWRAQNRAWDGSATIDYIGGFEVGFPGQYYDVESGLWHNYHRTYDASTGRYLQSDPIGLEGGLNTYAYAANNPIRLTDPSGLVVQGSGFGTASPGSLILNANGGGAAQQQPLACTREEAEEWQRMQDYLDNPFALPQITIDAFQQGHQLSKATVERGRLGKFVDAAIDSSLNPVADILTVAEVAELIMSGEEVTEELAWILADEIVYGAAARPNPYAIGAGVTYFGLRETGMMGPGMFDKTYPPIRAYPGGEAVGLDMWLREQGVK